jgi:hypothetical protein
MTPYTILVDDNGHHQDETERYEYGIFDSYDEAVLACQRLVDAYLARQFLRGMSAADLYRLYTTFGEGPFIRPEHEGYRFSAREYARLRCELLCAG